MLSEGHWPLFHTFSVYSIYLTFFRGICGNHQSFKQKEEEEEEESAPSSRDESVLCLLIIDNLANNYTRTGLKINANKSYGVMNMMNCQYV